jgi:hypothetical protein
VALLWVYGGRRRQRADRPRRRLRSCSPDSGDMPAIRGGAKGNAIRHDVRAVHVCEGLPSAGFLAVARFPWLSRRVAGSPSSQWRCLTARNRAVPAMRSPGINMLGSRHFAPSARPHWPQARFAGNRDTLGIATGDVVVGSMRRPTHFSGPRSGSTTVFAVEQCELPAIRALRRG